jgi:hypothetical protein
LSSTATTASSVRILSIAASTSMLPKVAPGSTMSILLLLLLMMMM